MITSGLRLGSPAATTRGFTEMEFTQVGKWIVEVVDGIASSDAGMNAGVEEQVRSQVTALCAKFPIY